MAMRQINEYTCDVEGCGKVHVTSHAHRLGTDPVWLGVPEDWQWIEGHGLICSRHTVRVEIKDRGGDDGVQEPGEEDRSDLPKGSGDQ